MSPLKNQNKQNLSSLTTFCGYREVGRKHLPGPCLLGILCLFERALLTWVLPSVSFPCSYLKMQRKESGLAQGRGAISRPFGECSGSREQWHSGVPWCGRQLMTLSSLGCSAEFHDVLSHLGCWMLSYQDSWILLRSKSIFSCVLEKRGGAITFVPSSRPSAG